MRFKMPGNVTSNDVDDDDGDDDYYLFFNFTNSCVEGDDVYY